MRNVEALVLLLLAFGVWIGFEVWILAHGLGWWWACVLPALSYLATGVIVAPRVVDFRGKTWHTRYLPAGTPEQPSFGDRLATVALFLAAVVFWPVFAWLHEQPPVDDMDP